MTEEPLQDAHEATEDAPEAAEAPEAPEDVFEEAEEPLDAPEVTDLPENADPAPATGHPAVDEVLRSLDALGDAPVDEHVAVFEQAHDQLRRTLQGAGDDE